MRKYATAMMVVVVLRGLEFISCAVAATPALLLDPETNVVLYSEDVDVPWQPASLTKLMTAYLAFSALRDGKLSPQDMLTCSERASLEPPSKVGLPVGGQMPVDLALKALVVKSANDVAIMLAEKIGGTEAEFVQQMNEAAKRLGMTGTKFVNPNGLPTKNPDGTEGAPGITTARDMALLATAILKEFPQYADLFALPSVRVGNRVLASHNSLLRTYDGADGMKTGFICASGYNIVASATHGNRKLIAVVLGETSNTQRSLRSAGLLEYGFSIYPWKALFAPKLAVLPVDKVETEPLADMHAIVCKPKLVKRSRRTPKRGKRKLSAKIK